MTSKGLQLGAGGQLSVPSAGPACTLLKTILTDLLAADQGLQVLHTG